MKRTKYGFVWLHRIILSDSCHIWWNINSEIEQLPRLQLHDDVTKWKHFRCYWPFVRGIHRSQVNSPHKSQWRRALIFCLIYAWINGWVNNREAGDLRRHRAHYDVIVMRCSGYQWIMCLWCHLKHSHDDVITWKYFPRYWPFVRGIHQWPVNSPHKSQGRGALMFSLICVWINRWSNNMRLVISGAIALINKTSM